MKFSRWYFSQSLKCEHFHCIELILNIVFVLHYQFYLTKRVSKCNRLAQSEYFHAGEIQSVNLVTYADDKLPGPVQRVIFNFEASLRFNLCICYCQTKFRLPVYVRHLDKTKWWAKVLSIIVFFSFGLIFLSYFGDAKNYSSKIALQPTLYVVCDTVPLIFHVINAELLNPVHFSKIIFNPCVVHICGLDYISIEKSK